MRSTDGSTGATLKKRKGFREGVFKHYVVTPPELFVPSSPSFHLPTRNDDVMRKYEMDEDDEDDPFDRLHHRHSLTTVTEESDSCGEVADDQRRYARFSAKTFDSRLTSRECSFVTYESWTPGSRERMRQRNSQRYQLPITPWTPSKRDAWTAGSSGISDFTEERRSSVYWLSDDETDYSLKETSDDFRYSTYNEGRHMHRSMKRRQKIERRKRRVVPSVLHVEPLLNPPDDVIKRSEDGTKMFAYSMMNKRTINAERIRKATPAVNQRLKIAYQSPHVHPEPIPQRSRLRATKSTRNICIV
uniref:uncharacterized protein LOC120341468 n=1 Tax=Styela clava TaxID=7725 RepID=UPI00193A65B7|nr:uncharacterized protein LOC120341468 [Styela clava]